MRYLVCGTGVVGQYFIRALIGGRIPGVSQIVWLSRKNRYRYEDYPGKESALLLDCYGNLQNEPIRLISMFQPDIILNASGQATQNSPNKELWQANTTNVINLLEACRVLPKVKFVQCSSIVCDDSVNTMYAASKLSAEHICRSYAKMYNNIHSYKFRFPAVVGAANRHGVVKDVVRKLKSDSDKLQLFGNEPGSKKPYVYAEQITRHILEYVNETDYKCGLYHLCPADIISVKEIAEIAMKKTGIYKEIEWRADAVWTHDKQLVLPTGSNFHMLSSYEATEKGIDDILREDYNETAN